MAAEPSVEKVQIMHVATEPEFQYTYEAVGPCVKKLLLVLGCFESYSGVPIFLFKNIVMAGIIAKKISCIMLVPTMYMYFCKYLYFTQVPLTEEVMYLYLRKFQSTCTLLKYFAKYLDPCLVLDVGTKNITR